MYSEAHLVKPQLETTLGNQRPTMVVEIEEPPTLTISSDEIIAFVERCLIILFRTAKKTTSAIGACLVFFYKKLSSISVHVSFEEIRENGTAVAEKERVVKVKNRYPGQLGLFTENSSGSAIPTELPAAASPLPSANKKEGTSGNVFWLTFIALSFGLAASVFLQ